MNTQVVVFGSLLVDFGNFMVNSTGHDLTTNMSIGTVFVDDVVTPVTAFGRLRVRHVERDFLKAVNAEVRIAEGSYGVSAALHGPLYPDDQYTEIVIIFKSRCDE